MFGLFARKGPFNCRVSSTGQVFSVGPEETVLKAALAAGIAWPNSCRVGSCGTCRSRLVSGKIKPLNDFSYVLNETELDEGCILACQSALRSDVEIDVALPDMNAPSVQTRAVSGTLTSLSDLTHDIKEVRIRLNEPLEPYVAGQFAELLLPHLDRPRSYSFASAPSHEGKNCVTFHVRHVPGGEMTTWVHMRARIGDAVNVKGPFGKFFLRESATPIVCIAGGSGMAPIKALLEDLADTGFSREVVYLYGARTQKDLYCLDEMHSIQDKSNGKGRFTFLPVLSHEPGESDWSGARGFVTDFIGRTPLETRSSEAYLCGPPPMIDAAIAQLKLLGVSDKRIFFDKFLDASHLIQGARASG